MQPPAQRRPHAFLADQLHLPGYRWGLGGDPGRVRRALAALGSARADVVVDAGSVMDPVLRRGAPERFFGFYIAGQQMMAAAIWMQAGLTPYLATFGAFLTCDFLRMAW